MAPCCSRCWARTLAPLEARAEAGGARSVSRACAAPPKALTTTVWRGADEICHSCLLRSTRGRLRLWGSVEVSTRVNAPFGCVRGSGRPIEVASHNESCPARATRVSVERVGYMKRCAGAEASRPSGTVGFTVGGIGASGGTGDGAIARFWSRTNK